MTPAAFRGHDTQESKICVQDRKIRKYLPPNPT